MADSLKSDSRNTLALAEQQEALQRLTGLVARAAPAEDLFSGLIEWVGELLPVDFVHLARYDPDRTMTFLASWSSAGDTSLVGTRLALGGNNLATLVFENGRPARSDSYVDASGPIGLLAREAGNRAGVATPIVVEGHFWGMLGAGSKGDAPLPSDIEERLALFAELLTSALASAESRAELARVAGEQAALRRVATLVARGAPSGTLFAAVAEEVGQLFQVDHASMCRYESDGTMVVLAAWSRSGEPFPVGSRRVVEGKNVYTLVAETGRPARLDHPPDASGVATRTAGRLRVGRYADRRRWAFMGRDGRQGDP